MTTSATPLLDHARARITSAAEALPRPPPLHPSLNHLASLRHCLPADMLVTAQSSPALSSAVADALGVRAVILTSNVAASDLPKWIAVLAPFVKAVSFFDVEALSAWSRHFGNTSGWDDGMQYLASRCKLSNWLAVAVSALKAMACPPVALRTLDITQIPFKHANGETKALLWQALVGALERNRDSIRELALPLTEMCVSALQQVRSLPNLGVLQLNTPMDYVRGTAGETGGWTGCDFIDVFKALEGGACANKCTAAAESGLELRIKHVMEPPRTGMEEYRALRAFCGRIERLEVRGWSWDAGDKTDRIASFVTLFSQIKCFRWDGAVTPRNMRTITSACPELTELHLLGAESDNEGGIAELVRVLEIAQGKLKTLRMNGAIISGELVRSLGQTNPDVRELSAEIDPESVAALFPLLSTHCRKLRTLDLRIFNPDEEEERCLRSEGWRRFAQAVQSASPELMDVIVECGSEHGPCEPDMDELVDSVASVLESLKDRARVVRFHVLVAVCEYGVMIGSLRRLIDVAKTRCCNLEELSLRFRVGDADFMWDCEEEKEAVSLGLLRARRNLWNALPKLHHLDLNRFDNEAEQTLQGFE